MSWISQNYEKASIGAAIVVAGGLAFLGWSKIGAVDEDFNVSTKGGGNKNTAVDGAEKIPAAISSLGQKRVWVPTIFDDRPVDLFVGIPLFLRKGELDKPVDPVKGAEIHAGIPNKWWIENRLDPGFADSPQRDADNDGFSNQEEFAASSNPNDPASHPILAAKLKYVRDESLQWLLAPGMELAPGQFTMQYFELKDGKKGENKAGAVDPVNTGDKFFTKGLMTNRFKLAGSEKVKEMNNSTHSEEERTYLTIEDLRENKKGVTYRIPNNIPDGRKKEFFQYDRTAVMTLEAIGQNGTEFKVEENTRFALPSTAAKKEYLLKKVTPEGIEVEYTTPSGETKTLAIPKG
ncbi:hypothetical protein KBB96_12170 [Luteolibacter ambystomatis]|uniref:Uncharacterized protein n=1 Tax=Luteolibacter ambystomatis TaxID=2824561 RepID=A0A975G6D7_9BACT|nr:Amuc_1099 family pilus-like system protein [Luteolibacter ambystomatis]QUE49628.1 hypothetical protein KBB96_12170 [Luteolibacter ambystomatis]